MSERTEHEVIHEAILDVLAPRAPTSGTRIPIFEWPQGDYPDEEELIELAEEIRMVVSSVLIRGYAGAWRKLGRLPNPADITWYGDYADASWPGDR